MAGWPILTLITFLPLVGAIFLMLVRGEPEEVKQNARNIALWTSTVTFVLSTFLWFGFDPSTAAFQFEERVAWIPTFNVNYHMGIDGISLFFVLLSTFLTPLAILVSWKKIKHRVREYMICFLLMETMIIGMFCSLDFLQFYLFYEAVLLPMFIIIGVWGGPRRIHATFKFFLYTMVGSVFMLIALLVFYFQLNTTDIPTIIERGHTLSRDMQIWLWLALLASFAVKIPMWPVHTWLPDAHVEAPTAASAMLAGVLLKMGGYGFLRFSIPMLPLATDYFTPLIYTLSVIALIYASLVAVLIAVALEDMKKLVAYSSVAHMGFGTLGMFTVTTQGMQGSIIVMVSHGMISFALFMCVGIMEERASSREIARFGGLVTNMPKYALALMIFMMASLGVPGTSGFVGEFLVLTGAFQINTVVASLAATSLVLGSVYMLWMYRLVVFGKLVRADCRSFADLSVREMAILAPLMAVVLWMGIYPDSFLHDTTASVANLIHNYQSALADAGGAIVAAR